jgi:hypothetical protein
MHDHSFVFPNKARIVRVEPKQVEDHDAEGSIMVALVAFVELNSQVIKL